MLEAFYADILFTMPQQNGKIPIKVDKKLNKYWK
jgi:hypothetical protein